MEEEVEDMHVCLKCNSCIMGLENYVLHRKTQCTAIGSSPAKANITKSDSVQANLPTAPTSSAASTAMSSTNSVVIPELLIDIKVAPQVMLTDLQQKVLATKQSNSTGNQQDLVKQEEQEQFSCPGCKNEFEKEEVFLAHIRVCAHITWPKSDEGTASNDDSSARDLTEHTSVAYGTDLDFRNIQPDGQFHCILCSYTTKSKEVIALHCKSKMHSETLHEYVESKLGEPFKFFERNEDNMLNCKPCAWQAMYRLEMEHHICQRLHHECIMNLITPNYSVYGKGKVGGVPDENQPKGILDLDDLAQFKINPKESKPDKGSNQDTEDNNVIDRMLKACHVRDSDSNFTCEICAYSTVREYDMRMHMYRRKHNQNVIILRRQFAKKGTVDLSAVSKSRQGQGQVYTKPRQLSGVNAPRGKQVRRPPQGGDDVVPVSIAKGNVVNKPMLKKQGIVIVGEENSSETVPIKSSSADNKEYDKVSAVRRSKRKRVSNFKYQENVDLSLNEESDQSDDNNTKGREKLLKTEEGKKSFTSTEVTPRKKKVGRPRRNQGIFETKPDSKLFTRVEYICEICTCDLSSLARLKEHYRTKEHKRRYKELKSKGNDLLQCHVCPAIFLNKAGYEAHVERHTLTKASSKYNVDICQCDACPIAFVSQGPLAAHKEKNCKGCNTSKVPGKEENSEGATQDDSNVGEDTCGASQDDGCKVQEDITLPGSTDEQEMDTQIPNGSDVKTDGNDNERSSDATLNTDNKSPTKQKCKKARRLFACEVCQFYSNHVKGLLDHIETMAHEAKECEVNGQEKTFQCIRCWETFYTNRLLDAHLEKHVQTQQEFKICAFCGEQVLREDYKEHCKKAGHEELVQPKMTGFKCNVCDKVMTSASSLADHKYIHTGQRPHKCPMCPFSSRRKGDISIHIKRHLGIRPFKCDQCDATFVKKSSLARHLGTHEKNRPRDIKCDLCDATFFNRVILRIHRRNVHERDKPRFFCEVEGCTHGSSTQSEIRHHMRSHTKEKPFLCTTCGQRTSTRKAMTIHQRIHTGDKPFKCTYEGCSYAARFDSHLRRHILVHTGAKPYKCPHCDYRSNVQENLRKHIKNSRKHKGMKMYKCNRCNEWEGDTMKEMINHIRNDHGIYVKRLEVANETGIFQKDVLLGNTDGEMEAETGEQSGDNVGDGAGTSESNELGMGNIPLMQGDSQSGLGNYEQQSSEELSVVQREVEEEHRDLINPAGLGAQARTQQLVVKLEERVGDIFNSLMAGGLG